MAITINYHPIFFSVSPPLIFFSFTFLFTLTSSHPPGSMAVREAWWDDKSNRINAVLCEISNPSLQLGITLGDCTMRLSLRLPSVLTLRNDAKIEGEIWSSKAVENSGYFRRINLTIHDDGYYTPISIRPNQIYKFTELDRARKSCSHWNKTAGKKKKGMSEYLYPDGQSDDMRFDLDIKDGDGLNIAWGTTTPVWVENDLFEPGKDTESAAIPELLKLDPAQKLDITWPTRMSYRITISSSFYGSKSLDWPLVYPTSGKLVTAKGLYDAETGHLCMVGCRKLMLQNSTSANFKDCEIVVELHLPMLNGERSCRTKGIIRSMRSQMDPLHFDDLVMDYAAYNPGEA